MKVSGNGERRVFVLPHLTSETSHAVTATAITGLQVAGVTVRMFAADAQRLDQDQVERVDEDLGTEGCELVAIFGGDGTILRGAELARGHGTPLLGINLGHVGFLAERESDEVEAAVKAIIAHEYVVEERMAIDIKVSRPDRPSGSGWALNEASVEKSGRDRMLDVVVAIDQRPLSRWGCDGVLCATPTGSTAYAWSAGGPVVWPDVEALVVVPSNAHALFARPMVISPESSVGVEVLPRSPAAEVWCDGRRVLDAGPGSYVEVRRSAEPVRLARFHAGSFTDRLVAKFQLPVEGWRGPIDDGIHR